jgi:hypothetical protein
VIKCSASACAARIVLYNAWKLLRPAVLELADIGTDPEPGITGQNNSRACTGPPWVGQVLHSQNGIQLLRRPSYRVGGQLFVAERPSES